MSFAILAALLLAAALYRGKHKRPRKTVQLIFNTVGAVTAGGHTTLKCGCVFIQWAQRDQDLELCRAHAALWAASQP